MFLKYMFLKGFTYRSDLYIYISTQFCKGVNPVHGELQKVYIYNIYICIGGRAKPHLTKNKASGGNDSECQKWCFHCFVWDCLL